MWQTRIAPRTTPQMQSANSIGLVTFSQIFIAARSFTSSVLFVSVLRHHFVQIQYHARDNRVCRQLGGRQLLVARRFADAQQILGERWILLVGLQLLVEDALED